MSQHERPLLRPPGAREGASPGISSHVPAAPVARLTILPLALPTQPGTGTAALVCCAMCNQSRQLARTTWQSRMWLCSSAKDRLHREREQFSPAITVSGGVISISGAVMLISSSCKAGSLSPIFQIRKKQQNKELCHLDPDQVRDNFGFAHLGTPTLRITVVQHLPPKLHDD